MNKVKNTFSKAKTACTALSMSATTLLVASPLAFATTKAVTALVSQIWNIFKYIGYLLAAWAVGMLVLAFKNEDADSKSRAMMLLVVSILLMSVQTIFNAMGLKI